MIYQHTKCPMPSSNIALVIAINLKAKENVRMDSDLVFCILQKYVLVPYNKLHILSTSITTHHFCALK
jgi:hypothetical protein